MGRVARLRMPAYAKALRDNRRRGFHPLAGVRLVYGDDWAEAQDAARLESGLFVKLGREAVPYGPGWPWPVLAIRPREFGPKVFDFSALAGVPVTVVDGCEASADVDVDDKSGQVTRWGLFYDLLSEVSTFASVVRLHGSVFDDDPDVRYLARDYRVGDVWPRWWSDDLDAHCARLESGWVADLARVTAPAGGALGAR